MTRAIQFVGLSMSGLLAGNELGTLIGAHPAMRALPMPAQIDAQQALTGRLKKIMPFYTFGTLLAAIAAAVDRAGKPGSGLTAAAATSTATMLGSTVVGNIPLNKATLSYPATGDPAQWAEIRRRWERLHTARVLLNITAFGCLAAAALVDRQRPA